MFWRKDQPQQPQLSPSETGEAIDPAAEEARLRQLTGGKAVIISRQEQGFKLKLPGL